MASIRHSFIRHLAMKLAIALLLVMSGLSAALAAGAAALHQHAAAAGTATPASSPELTKLLEAFPNGLTPAQVEAVAGTADAGTARAALREMLARHAAGPPAEAADVETEIEFYRDRLGTLQSAYATLPASLERGFDVDAVNAAHGPIEFVTIVGGIVLLSVLAAWFVHRWLDRWAAAAAGRSPTIERLTRLLADIAAPAVFVGMILVVYLAAGPKHPAIPDVLSALLRAATIIYGIVAVSRLILAPDRSDLRLAPVDDMTAITLRRMLVISSVLILLPSTVARILAARAGLTPEETLAIALPLSIPPFVYLMVLLARHRHLLQIGLAKRLGLAPARHPWLALLPVLLGLYLVAIWLLAVNGQLRGETSILPKAVGSLAILLLIPLFGRFAHQVLEHFFAASAAPAADAAAAGHDNEMSPVLLAKPAPSLSAAEHVQKLMRAVWVVLGAGGVVLTAILWGFRPEQVGFGDIFVRLVLNVGVILLLAYVGWALFQRWIDRRLELARCDRDATRAQRLQTLLPLFRAFVRVVIFAVVAMILLSSIGIQIGPLLAGAGVVGLAIGLGAQQTIADILAGVFFLLEDSFRMGDYVEVGQIRGTVEGISLRSLKLRHQRGMLHTLPFGQIRALTNFTRDWALMRLEFRLEPHTDLALVKKLVKQIGKELAADPEFGPGFIDPPKSQGVRQVEDSAIVIGVKYITKPGKQFTVRREIFQRLLRAFRQHGIELVGRGVVVRVEGGKDVPPEVLGAAAEAGMVKPPQAA